MATVLDKELKRQVSVDDADYILALDPDGFRLTGKGKRTPLVALRWRDLLSGEAALAVALNASLLRKPSQPAAKAASDQPPPTAHKRAGTPARQPAAKKSRR